MTIIIKLICIIYIQNSMELLNDNYNKIELYNLYSNLIELLNTIGIKLICIIYIQIQWNY
jgi:hypothetical protein